MSRRALSWLAVATVAIGALLYGAIDEGSPRTDSDRAYAIAKTIGCPVCSGQSVAESDAVIAESIRASIAKWIDEGRSDEFIRAALVERLGEDVDYTPSASGVTSLVWILPVVVVAGAVAGLVVAFRRWRDDRDLEASDHDREIVAAARREPTDE